MFLLSSVQSFLAVLPFILKGRGVEMAGLERNDLHGDLETRLKMHDLQGDLGTRLNMYNVKGRDRMEDA